MNDEDLLTGMVAEEQPEPEIVPPTPEEKEVKEEVVEHDKVNEAQAEQQLTLGQVLNPFGPNFLKSNPNATAADYGFTPVQNPNELRFESELDPIAKDPISAIEYAAAYPTGALDTVTGAYNTFTGGFDIPYIPEFQNKGAQAARNIASIFAPMGPLNALRLGAAGKLQKQFAWARDPLVKFLGMKSSALGQGALVDLVAPMQGDTEGQTLLGSLYELSPRYMGWVPEDLRILDGDSPDDARRKNMLEGAGFGAIGDLIEIASTMARGRKGLKDFTSYIPENEKAGAYFSKTKPAIPETVEDAVNSGAFRREVDLDEVGNYNFTREQYNGYDPEELVIFGKDTDLYSYGENGIRSADDMGIVGASVDAARIGGNIDSVYGRIRNPISEGALKFSLEAPAGVPRLLQGLGDELANAGVYGYRTATGKLVSSKSILNSLDALSADMLNMPVKEMKRLISDLSKMSSDGLPVLTKEGQAVVKKALDDALMLLADTQRLHSTALVDTSFAGQISDMAWGMRMYDGTDSVMRLQTQILDRIELLQTLRGTTNYALNKLVRTKSFWAKLTGAEKLSSGEKYSREIAERMTGKELPTLEALELIQEDSKNFVASLRDIAAKRPAFLKPMALLYEMTDGSARQVTQLNEYLRHSTGTLSKAFLDGKPEIPSVIMQGFWSTAFNSALSGVKTPLKAGVSNLSTWVMKPLSQFPGMFMNGNTRELQGALYAYGQASQVQAEAMQYAKRLFVRSAESPHLMRGRDEIVYKTDKQMGLFRAVAEAASKEGNDGPAMLFDMMQVQKDLAEHPALRIGNRSMLFSDAWQTSTNAQLIARQRAWDEVTSKGLNPVTNQEMVDQLAKKNYEAMFDENGIIRDQQTLTQTAKQTFSQDNPLSTLFQEFMQRVPGLKPFFMFTRSPVNSLSYGAQFQPVGAFINKTKRFELPFEEMPAARVERLLSEEGIDVANTIDVRAEYNRLRDTYKGASALGVSFVMAGVYGYLSGNITGRAGLYDQKTQSTRVKAGWKPMRAFGVDYSQIPGVSDWIALTIDILDNAHAMRSEDTGELLRAMGYVLGANLLERTQLQNVEQLSDVLQGNPAAIQRWTVNTTFNSTTLVGGALGTLNQVMAPQLKAVEQQLVQLLLNRIPGKPGLPDDYDFIDGGKINWVENPVLRMYNAFSPFPYHPQPSEAKSYLQAVEFDVELGMSSRSDGVPYTKAELAQIKKLMGENKTFQREILQIKKQFPAAKFKEDYFTAQGKGLEPDKGTFMGLHARLADAQERAKLEAELQMPELMRKKDEEAYVKGVTTDFLKSGDVQAAERWLQETQQKGLY